VKNNSTLARVTKIVATVGPVTLDFSIFKQIITEGVDYIRINTAYGNYEQYDLILRNIKEVEDIRTIPILFDIKTTNVLEYAIKNNINMIAISFAKDATHIQEIRKIIPDGFLIAKIESLDGLKNLDEIISAADGIMIARGDLGLAIPLEKVPLIQKQIIYQTIKKKKFLITATDMLLSMTQNSLPTRAEASDVANAVLDHSCALMLSEETAIGKHPIDAVRFMRRMIEETEWWERNNELTNFPKIDL